MTEAQEANMALLGTVYIVASSKIMTQWYPGRSVTVATVIM